MDTGTGRAMGSGWGLLLAAAWLIYGTAAQAQEADMIVQKVADKGTGTFHCDAAPALLLGKGALKQPGCVGPLQELLKQRFGETASAPAAAGPYILAGLSGDRGPLRELAASIRAKLPQQGLGEEGYVLDVAPERVLLAASKPSGLFRGATALVRMAAGQPGSLEIPAGIYADWPAVPWRGMHVLVGGRSNLPALEQIITRSAPELRINKLILEVDYNFAFKSHPEMAAPDGLTVEDCRHLSDLARRYGIELIPQVNCLGHQSWAKNTDRLLTAHPEFDETPDLPADNPGIYCRSWCPSKPEVARFVGDLIDEIIDAFGSHWFHCGMDEVFILGECPRCKGIDHSELFARAINDLHARLAKRKVGMMIWGDRLIDAKATGYSKWEASENGTAPAINHIPKDIVLCDWHYGTPDDFPSVKILQDAGFRVWPSGWNSSDNVRRLASCALSNAGPRMVGYMATTWFGLDQVAAGLAGEESALKNKDTKSLVAGIRTGLAMAWNGDTSAHPPIASSQPK